MVNIFTSDHSGLFGLCIIQFVIGTFIFFSFSQGLLNKVLEKRLLEALIMFLSRRFFSRVGPTNKWRFLVSLE